MELDVEKEFIRLSNKVSMLRYDYDNLKREYQAKLDKIDLKLMDKCEDEISEYLDEYSLKE